jgi:hypothetical protein
MRCASAVLCDAAAAAALLRLQLISIDWQRPYTITNYSSSSSSSKKHSQIEHISAKQLACKAQLTAADVQLCSSRRSAAVLDLLRLPTAAAHTRAVRERSCVQCCMREHMHMHEHTAPAYLATLTAVVVILACLRGRGRAESSLCNSAAAVHAGKCAYLSVPYGERITPLRLSLPYG